MSCRGTSRFAGYSAPSWLEASQLACLRAFLFVVLGVGLMACGEKDGAPVAAAEASDAAQSRPKTPGPAPVDAATIAVDLARAGVSPLTGLRPLGLGRVRTMLRRGQRQQAIAALRYSLSAYVSEDDKHAGTYILGRLLTEEGDPAGLQFLTALPAPFEPIEHLRLVWLARAQILNHLDAAAVKTIESLFNRYEALPEAENLRLAQAAALYRLGRKEEAMLALEWPDHANASEPVRARSTRMVADWLRELDLEAAQKEERVLLVRYPTDPAALEPGLSLGVEDLTDAERFNRAKNLDARWGYEEARREFKRLVDKGEFLYESQWRIGLISLRNLRDDPAGARAMFEAVSNAGGPYKDQAAYYVVRSYLQEDNYEAALQAGKQYTHRFPKGRFVDNISYYRGWLPYDRGNCEEALPEFADHIKTFDYKRAIVMGFVGWCHIRQQEWQKAIDAFESLNEQYNGSVERGKGLYWQAYAFVQLGQAAEAKAKIERIHQRYPLTYYDLLAQQLDAVLDGRDPTASKLPWTGKGDADERFPIDEAMWELPKSTSGSRSKFERVRRLVELDEIDLARREYGEIVERVEAAVPDGRRLEFVRFMSAQVDDYNRGWQEVDGKLTMLGDPDSQDIRWVLAYPQAYQPIVETLSREYEVPEALVYAIMRQESRYQPTAISGADAVGALQMIPPTAKKIAVDMGIAYDPLTFPRPDVGFRYSFFYLRKHLEAFRGQIVPTAASYNGGPEPIVKWIGVNKGKPMSFLVEEFAYNESRIYCRMVAEHMLRYLYLYEDDAEVRGKLLDAMFPVEFNADLAVDERLY